MDRLVQNECVGLRDEWNELKNILKSKGVDLTETDVISGIQNQPYTANVFAVKITGFPCVTLKPCKVHVIFRGKSIPQISL